MALVKCKECGAGVAQMANRCPHCGVKKPGFTAKDYVAGAVVLIAVVLIVVTFWGDKESDNSDVGPTEPINVFTDPRGEETLHSFLGRQVHGKSVETAYVIESTAYAHMVFDEPNMFVKGHLLDIKELMPSLLEGYPDIDRFFFGFQKDSAFYMKVNISRQKVKGVSWSHLLVDELPPLFDSYWLLPSLR